MLPFLRHVFSAATGGACTENNDRDDDENQGPKFRSTAGMTTRGPEDNEEGEDDVFELCSSNRGSKKSRRLSSKKSRGSSRQENIAIISVEAGVDKKQEKEKMGFKKKEEDHVFDEKVTVDIDNGGDKNEFKGRYDVSEV